MNPVKAASTLHPSAIEPAHATQGLLDADALAVLATRIRQWGHELGFDAVGISDTDLSDAEQGLQRWLAAGFHGEMDYMAKHGLKRARPAELVPGTLRVISLRMAYLPAFLPDLENIDDAATRVSPAHREPGARRETSVRTDWRAAQFARNDQPEQAVVSVYARGRDYHKVLRNRLQKLAERIESEIGPFGYRVFTDSAPVLEVELATRAQIGWRGKHTLLLERDAGSFFFLGEIFVDLPLPADASPVECGLDDAQAGETPPLDARSVAITRLDAAAIPPLADVAQEGAVDSPATHVGPVARDGHCGTCTRCIDICPTGAIVAPYQVDARRCISYLTIELAGSIPEALRPLIGNRIYGCDDCQLVCPWNKFARRARIDDFDARNNLDRATLLELWEWTAQEFDDRLAGTAIRRIGYERWVRNLAVGLGNALRATGDDTQRRAFADALRSRSDDPSALIREHVEWALRAA